MTQYYVYNIKSDDKESRVHAFVENPLIFAMDVYDPETMEFSGVLVEADSPEQAQKVYLQPQAEDILISCCEPIETVTKRKKHKFSSVNTAVDKLEIASLKLRIQTLAAEVALDFYSMSQKISELSRLIRKTSSSKEKVLTSKDIYGLLLKKYTDVFAKLKYKPGENGSEEQG